MRSVEKSARSVDEAVVLALQELGVGREQVDVAVLEEPRSGLFGLLARPAVVRVTVRAAPPAPAVVGDGAVGGADRPEQVRRFLTEVCLAMGLAVRLEVREASDAVQVDVFGDEAGLLIGHHGQTLEALQFLANMVAARVGAGPRIILDVEGYRRRREETLMRLAERLAERVRRSGERVVLEPMSAHERRVIHVALADHSHVTTTSEGEEPNRRVVILPKR